MSLVMVGAVALVVLAVLNWTKISQSLFPKEALPQHIEVSVAPQEEEEHLIQGASFSVSDSLMCPPVSSGSPGDAQVLRVFGDEFEAR